MATTQANSAGGIAVLTTFDHLGPNPQPSTAVAHTGQESTFAVAAVRNTTAKNRAATVISVKSSPLD
jgi:hypothetical protein